MLSSHGKAIHEQMIMDEQMTRLSDFLGDNKTSLQLREREREREEYPFRGNPFSTDQHSPKKLLMLKLKQRGFRKEIEMKSLEKKSGLVSDQQPRTRTRLSLVCLESSRVNDTVHPF